MSKKPDTEGPHPDRFPSEAQADHFDIWYFSNRTKGWHCYCTRRHISAANDCAETLRQRHPRVCIVHSTFAKIEILQGVPLTSAPKIYDSPFMGPRLQ